MKPASDLRAGRCFPLGAFVCFAICLAFAAQARAEADESQSAQALLQRMAHAVRFTNYVGICVYRFGNTLQAIHVVHQARDGHWRERLSALSGSQREIIRGDVHARDIQASGHSVAQNLALLDTPFGTAFSGDPARTGGFEDMQERYRLELRGAERVAAREASRLHIVPRDQFRYGYRLWIDKRSGLLLRSDLIDDSGVPLEQIMFTSIETPETIAEHWFESARGEDQRNWHRERIHSGVSDKVAADTPGWVVDDVPQGFKLTYRGRRPVPANGQGHIEHWLYSDGLATVSVYIRPQSEHPFTGWSRMGAISTFGRTLDDYQVIVVGEVPPATVQRIGASVCRSADAQ